MEKIIVETSYVRAALKGDLEKIPGVKSVEGELLDKRFTVTAEGDATEIDGIVNQIKALPGVASATIQ